jgi:hypothetical protein
MRKSLKTLTALAAGAALAILASSPASAATYVVDDISGNIDIYEFFGTEPLQSVPIGEGEDEPCEPADSELVANSGSPNPLSFDSTTVTNVNIGPDAWIAEMTIELDGTWSGSGPWTGSASGSAQVTLTERSADCTPAANPDVCFVDAGNITATGSFSHSPLSLPTGGTITLTGANSDGDLSVTGSCGVISGADSGRVEFSAVATVA